jgi:hypothetical protein
MRKLIVNGRLRITLTPLLKELPIVGTMQARANQTPSLSLA